MNKLLFEEIHPNAQNISIFVIWLFHISAIVGISLGYFDWFATKTPLNLMMVTGLLLFNFPLNTLKKLILFAIIFVLGMTVEWIGVHYDFLFGSYTYGDNLGAKLDGVPWLIGANWAILILICGAIADKLKAKTYIKILFGAFLMVLLDFFIEVPAAYFDYWHWEIGHAPLQNFIAWYLISSAMLWLYYKFKVEGNFKFGFHLYISQFVYFSYFYAAQSL